MKKLKKNFKIEDGIFINFVNINVEEKEIVRNWRNDKNIRQWMYNDHKISSLEHAEFLEKLKYDKKNFYWLIKKNQEYIGVIYFNKVDLKNKNAYFGIYTNPENYKKGNGQLIFRYSKKIIFEIANFHTIKLEVIENNHKAINFYKKVGFFKEGTLKEFIFKDGKWLDVIIMGIVN